MSEPNEATGEKPRILSWSGSDTAALLHEVAAWLDANPSCVLINISSVGFGEPWEVVLQVTVADERPDAGVTP